MSPVPPAGLVAIADRVNARLESFLTPELARWAEFDADLADPMAEIGRLVLGGGKRLRPAFCHWGFIAAGGEPAVAESDPGPVVDAGAAFELMHAFALFHDDVMDDADARRGAETAHRRFAARHRQGSWAGEDRRFGEGIAILVGDLAFVYSDQLLRGAPSAAWRVWNELRIELNVGQLLDIVGSVKADRTITRAERICRYKSGKYTVERPLHLGAALAAPDRVDDLMPVLSAYGLPLGDAFQMRDDVIGAFGDPSVTGKPVGGDLREGKLMGRPVTRSVMMNTPVPRSCQWPAKIAKMRQACPASLSAPPPTNRARSDVMKGTIASKSDPCGARKVKRSVVRMGVSISRAVIAGLP